MKIGKHGQVTIPREIRDRFGFGPETEVEFRVVAGNIVLKKAPKKLNFAKWKGRCGDTFAKLDYPSVDKFIDVYAVDDHRGARSYRRSRPQ